MRSGRVQPLAQAPRGRRDPTVPQPVESGGIRTELPIDQRPLLRGQLGGLTSEQDGLEPGQHPVAQPRQRVRHLDRQHPCETEVDLTPVR